MRLDVLYYEKIKGLIGLEPTSPLTTLRAWVTSDSFNSNKVMMEIAPRVGDGNSASGPEIILRLDAESAKKVGKALITAGEHLETKAALEAKVADLKEDYEAAKADYEAAANAYMSAKKALEKN